MTETIRHAWGQSALGDFLAAASARGLVMVEFGDAGGPLVGSLRDRYPEATVVEDAAGMAETLRQVAAQIEQPGQPVALPLDLHGSDFELRVWQALREIPAGQTAAYGEIAARIGLPMQAREVAEACAANRLAVLVPCHRVVKKDGSIAGYRWGFARKRALLGREREAFALTA